MERSTGTAETAPSSLATVQEIERRLRRPSSLPSPSPPSRCYSSRFEVNLKEEARQREPKTKTRRLEDYLDPSLLCTISSKVARAKKDGEMKPKKKELCDFEWPADELKAFVEDSRPEKIGGDHRKDDDEAVNLNDDLDPPNDGTGYEDQSCTPFGRLERMALKSFGW
ncbi:uncharacterized protein LOC131160098 [Malania oleifera]|uniref:uncharacterized protein LOC131160098 n=1 Tax=Malania oleifera TaxID=397392 RepID=UPI0025AE4682|nr:uncharacterized protein LOC131160098 [Malania oleifera]